MVPSFVLAMKNATEDHDCGNTLSNLPDSIIHHIFSYLYMNEFVRLAVLSKRFRKLCLSNPNIYLTLSPKTTSYPENWRARKLVDRFFYENDCYSRKNYHLSNCSSVCKGFFTFMDNYMCHRGDSPIQSLHLELTKDCSVCCHKERESLNAWLHQATKCDIQELYLNINIGFLDQSPYALPQSLFGSKCLKVLELDLHHDKFELPLAVLGSLEMLSMNCSCLLGELPIGEWIPTCCPSLKKLSLLYIKDLNLESCSITDLTLIPNDEFTLIVVSCVNLQALSVDLQAASLDERDNEDCRIQVSAPNLEVLSCGGNLERYIDFGAFPRLKDATLYRCRSEGADRFCLDSLFNLVKSSSSATFMRVPLCIAEVLFLKDQEHLMLKNLRCLVIRCDPGELKKYHSAIIMDFTRRSPNLTSLTIEIEKEKSWSHREMWGSDVKKLVKKKVRGRNWKKEKLCQRVKEVTIKLFGIDNHEDRGMELVKHFLQTETGLEKMTIFYQSSCFDKLSTVLDRANRGSTKAIKVVTHVKEVILVFYEC